jgi:hypothetical protein
MASCVGLDLWHYTDAKGRGLRKATDFLAGYRGRQADWPHQELKWPSAELDELLTRADWAWGPGRYPRSDAGTLALRYTVAPHPTR